MLACTRYYLCGSCARHQQEVEHVRVSSSTEMCVAETHDGLVGVVVTRTPVPATVVRIRTELHHAERHGGSRIGVSVPAGADRDLNELRYIFRSGERR